jgi:hypothetical protein
MFLIDSLSNCLQIKWTFFANCMLCNTRRHGATCNFWAWFVGVQVMKLVHVAVGMFVYIHERYQAQAAGSMMQNWWEYWRLNYHICGWNSIREILNWNLPNNSINFADLSEISGWVIYNDGLWNDRIFFVEVGWIWFEIT